MEENKFDIFVPIDVEGSIAKTAENASQEGTEGDWYVQGYASTPDLDLQGDIVKPTALNIDYFVKSGWLNYEHSKLASDVIGVPTEACYVDPERGLYVEAKLFKDNPKAVEMWQLAKSLSRAKVNRYVGFSIEGSIRKRSDKDARVIEDVLIKNVALTKNPANPHATWEALVKSWETGHETNPEKQENGSAIRKESLAQAITQLTYAFDTLKAEELDQVWKDVASYLDQSDKNTETNSVLLLQLSKGISRKEAQAFLTNPK